MQNLLLLPNISGMKIVLKTLSAFGACMLLTVSAWTFCHWGRVPLEQVVANLPSISNAGRWILQNFLLFALVPAAAAAMLFARAGAKITAMLWLAAIIAAGINFEIPAYLQQRHVVGTLYEREYIRPPAASALPNRPRNIVLLYLESFEQNYLSDPVLAPNLLRLSEQNLSFAGFHQLYGTNYTMSALVASLCGVTYYPQYGDAVNIKHFLPQLPCIPSFLAASGYYTELIKGASLKFSGADVFAREHGFVGMAGYEEISANAKYRQNGNSWGLSDRGILAYTRDKISELAAKKQPFFVAAVTLDMHEPDIFVDPACPVIYHDERDAVVCVDSQIGDFVDWMQAQPFYADTLLVIAGDHIKPGNLAEERQILNIFINSAADFAIKPHRWTTLDMAPTVLAAAGFPVADWGLGRSLSSTEPTLYDRFGGRLDVEVRKRSDFYQRFYSRPTLQNTPKTLVSQNEYSGKDIVGFSEDYQDRFGTIYLRQLAFRLPHTDGEKLQIAAQTMLLNKKSSKTIYITLNGKSIAPWQISASEAESFVREIALPAGAADFVIEFSDVPPDSFAPQVLPLGVQKLRFSGI